MAGLRRRVRCADQPKTVRTADPTEAAAYHAGRAGAITVHPPPTSGTLAGNPHGTAPMPSSVLHPPRSDADRNLLFGVLALQAGLLDPARFADACSGWAARKDLALADL